MTGHPEFNWGISTLGCPELTLEALCTLAASRDIHALEIRSLAGRMDLPAYFDEAFQSPGAVQAVLDRFNQKIISLNSSFTLISATEKDRNELLEFARWAEALSVPYIRIFGGGKITEPLSADDLKRIAENLNWWYDVRRQKGWTTQVALETHSGFSSARRCLLLQEFAQQPLDVVWDTHHTWKLGGESPWQSWDQFSHMVCLVQIKDSISVPSGQHPYTYVLPGTGEFPAQEVFTLLKENHYQGVLSLEWERQWYPALPPIDQALDALVANGWKNPAYGGISS